MKVFLTVFFILILPLRAHAHLTWMDVGQHSLGLSTGHNYPAKEISVKGEYVDSIECLNAQLQKFKLVFNPGSIRYPFTGEVKNCTARLKTSLIELSVPEGLQHFQENKVRQALVDKVKASGQFKESYFKLAQMRPIDMDSPLYSPGLAQFVRKSGDPESIYVYQHGLPLAGLPVGLEYPETPITLWTQTDQEGKVRLLLKPKTKALLRTLVVEDAEPFSSQFLSVVLEPK